MYQSSCRASKYTYSVFQESVIIYNNNAMVFDEYIYLEYVFLQFISYMILFLVFYFLNSPTKRSPY